MFWLGTDPALKRPLCHSCGPACTLLGTQSRRDKTFQQGMLLGMMLQMDSRILLGTVSVLQPLQGNMNPLGRGSFRCCPAGNTCQHRMRLQ
jgi:hypothetical protein